MTKLFKRVSTVAMAAVMATTIAVSANAAESAHLEADFCGGVADGYIKSNSVTNTVTVYTTYSDIADRLYVAADVVNTLTGEDITSLPRTVKYNSTRVAYTSPTIYSNTPITVFSAHEVFVGSNVWGDYNQLYNVML